MPRKNLSYARLLDPDGSTKYPDLSYPTAAHEPANQPPNIAHANGPVLRPRGPGGAAGGPVQPLPAQAENRAMNAGIDRRMRTAAKGVNEIRAENRAKLENKPQLKEVFHHSASEAQLKQVFDRAAAVMDQQKQIKKGHRR